MFTKSSALEMSNDANKATAQANASQNPGLHSDAASLHKIAAEAHKLTGNPDLAAAHENAAGQHDAIAQNMSKQQGNQLTPGSTNNNTPPHPSGQQQTPAANNPDNNTNGQGDQTKPQDNKLNQVSEVISPGAAAAQNQTNKQTVDSKLPNNPQNQPNNGQKPPGSTKTGSADQSGQGVSEKQGDSSDNNQDDGSDENPYDPNTPEGQAWLEGYQSAQADDAVNNSGDDSQGQDEIDDDDEMNSRSANTVKPVNAKDAGSAYKNEDGTFKGPDKFGSCVAYMQSTEGHSEESAKKICGYIKNYVKGRGHGDFGLNAKRSVSEKSIPLYASISSRLIAENKSLQASITGGGFNTCDLMKNVGEAVCNLPMFQPPQTLGTPCCSPWVTNLVTPGDDGGLWSAVFSYGVDCKLFAVDFNIEPDGSVSLMSEPEEVKQDTQYKYVDNILAIALAEARAAGAQAALQAEEAGHEFHGNQYQQTAGSAHDYMEHAKHMREIEKAPLEDRKAAENSVHEHMQNPDSYGERAQWMLNGDYGKGAYDAAHRIAQNTRMNRTAGLGQLVGAYEHNSPPRHTVAAFKRLTPEQQTAVNNSVNTVLKRYDEDNKLHAANAPTDKSLKGIDNGSEYEMGEHRGDGEPGDKPAHLNSVPLADMATEIAEQATNHANDDPSTDSHDLAKVSHENAYGAHKHAYGDLIQAGADDDQLQHHLDKMQDHFDKKCAHEDAGNAIKSSVPANSEAIQALYADIRAAIEAGDYPGHPFHGNQHTGGQGNIASRASGKAHEASKNAKTPQEHRAAAALHRKAAQLHAKRGDNDTAMYHQLMSQYHSDEAKDQGKSPKTTAAHKASAEAIKKSNEAVEKKTPEAHAEASKAHGKAYKANKEAGNTEKAKKHIRLTQAHHHESHGEHGGYLPRGGMGRQKAEPKEKTGHTHVPAAKVSSAGHSSGGGHASSGHIASSKSPSAPHAKATHSHPQKQGTNHIHTKASTGKFTVNSNSASANGEQGLQAHDGENLSADDIHYGAQAKKDFENGQNPPGWGVDEDTWDKAKEAASKTYSLDDDSYWPVTVGIYKKMGGTIKGKKPAKSSYAGGQNSLMAGGPGSGRHKQALSDLIQAGEKHMEAHPSDGSGWHKANAEFYKALTKAKSALGNWARQDEIKNAAHDNSGTFTERPINNRTDDNMKSLKAGEYGNNVGSDTTGVSDLCEPGAAAAFNSTAIAEKASACAGDDTESNRGAWEAHQKAADLNKKAANYGAAKYHQLKADQHKAMAMTGAPNTAEDKDNPDSVTKGSGNNTGQKTTAENIALTETGSPAETQPNKNNAKAGSGGKGNVSITGPDGFPLDVQNNARRAARLKALEASSPPELSTAANVASDNADKATAQADQDNTAESHKNAYMAHKQAFEAHKSAYDSHSANGGDPGFTAQHEKAMRDHQDAMDDHMSQAKELDACYSRDAGFAKELLKMLVADGHNPTLQDIVKGLEARFSIKMNEAQVARALVAADGDLFDWGDTDSGDSGDTSDDSEAFQEGYDADTGDSCPYDPESDDGQAWLNGYDAGHDDTMYSRNNGKQGLNAGGAYNVAAQEAAQISRSADSVPTKNACLDAAKAHDRACNVARDSGMQKESDYHFTQAQNYRQQARAIHTKQAYGHVAAKTAEGGHGFGKCPNCGDTENAGTAIEGEDTRCGKCMMKAPSSDWKAVNTRYEVNSWNTSIIDTAFPLEASGRAAAADPLLDGVIQYMPGGTHRITPSQGGKPVTVTLVVDAASAEAIEEERQALAAKGKDPFFSVQHSTEIAAFWPKKFFWDTRVDARGELVEGVWAQGMWTKAGRESVEGKDFRTFSPTFFVDEVRDDPSNPAVVVCNENARANLGALENDPAFQKMSPLWAKNALNARNAGMLSNDQNKAKLEALGQIRSQFAALNAAGLVTTLAELTDVLNRNSSFKLDEEDVARALAQ